MKKLFFILATRMNARIADTVISGGHISLEGFTYLQLTRRPIGKNLKRSLVNEETQERILIYG